MVEILGGNGLELAFIALGIDAVQTYVGSQRGEYGEVYEVWELSQDDFDRLYKVKEWHEDWGWLRRCEGSNMGLANVEYVINGHPIIAWDGIEREKWCDRCVEGVCSGSDEDKLECYHNREYSNLFEYSCEEIGASTERNFCAIATDLARWNGMTLSELFHQYMG